MSDDTIIKLEDYNRYVQLVVDLINNPNHTKLNEWAFKRKVKRGFFGLREEVPSMQEISSFLKSKDQGLAEVSDKLREYYNELRLSDTIDFQRTWEFLQFCRWAEKVLFYDNSVNTGIYVDSDLMQFSERIGLFNFGENDRQSVSIKMERIDNPKYNPDSLIKQEKYLNTINLVVSRNFGKKMKNTFLIVNGEVAYNDSSDEHLFKIISDIINSKMATRLVEIITWAADEKYKNESK